MDPIAGRYHLVDPIADGGMGSVWRAWDARRGRYVAAKLLRPSDAGSLLRFVREQSLRIEHPHVVAPNGWAGDDDTVLLTMDLVAGGTVHQLIADYGALPVPFAAVLVDQLWSALIEVHGHGIVHRDVKPGNLLLDDTGRGRPSLRLSDFGIALVKGDPRLTELAAVMGTYGYVAPEAMAGEDPHAGHDVYSAAVVAHHMITGEAPPREGLTIDEERVPPGVPSQVWQVLTAMLAADVSRRPADAIVAQQWWRQALGRARVPAIDPADPEGVEVFHHLDPLPTGFGPDGPTTSRPVYTGTPVTSSPTAASAPPVSPATVPHPHRRVAGFVALGIAVVGVATVLVSLVLMLT